MNFSRSAMAASSCFFFSVPCASISFRSAATACSASFMLESSERFVGLYGATLVAVLARAILPLLRFELELLAFGDNLAVGFFSGGNFSAGAAELGIGFANAFRKSFQFSAQSRNLVVNALKLDQVRYRRMHGRSILAQGAAGFARTAAADRMRSFRMQGFGLRSFQGEENMPHV